MKKSKYIILTLIFILATTLASAQQRRPVDSQHPMWLVHVDVWNQADPQKIIDLIPDDIKPYVVMNLSLSCAYDTELNIHQRPQNAIPTYKSWATVCQMNNMWFTLQPASGGHTHIHDNDLEIFEYFFKKYPNFLGWNFAEQFWGFNNPGDLFSSSEIDRIELFANLVPMHHKYGGFLTISFCGNVWSHHLNPVGMMKRNAKLLQACKDYPESILWLYKYTTSSCFYNNESVSFGPFVAGLTRNYGVRYDNCGWNGATSELVGENQCKYPNAAGIGTVMEQTCQNGGAVWDGPELIWTEDFQNLSDGTVKDGTKTYKVRRWGTFPGFRNVWMDMWRKVIDGTMYIPTQQEVIDKTKIILVNDVKSGSDEDKYATWGDLYDGIYKQSDPFNRNNGQWMDNFWYLKKTGRYGTIPMTPCLTDLSTGIETKVKKSQRNSVWSSQNVKISKFNQAYPEVSTGDLFVSRYRNQLVTYTPYTYLNEKTTASANVPLLYNTCTSMDLTWGKLSSALVKEYADSICFYMNNFRSDTVKNVEDKIVINGVTAEPKLSWTKRVEASATVTPSWDAAKGIYTLVVSHNGPVDVKIECQGAETNRQTDYVANAALPRPVQPEDYYGTLIIEAEDMDNYGVQSMEQTPYYSSYRWVRGQSGNGFVVMGTNAAGALRKVFKVKKGGEYRIAVRYCNTHKDDYVRIRINDNAAQRVKFLKTESNVWRKDTITATLNAGENKFYLLNTMGIDMMVDQVIFSPADEELEKFDITMRQSEHGSPIASVESAYEGQYVTISANPVEGYTLKGWNIIHGKIDLTENADGTFSFYMPDDIVTLEPIYVDNTIVYKMDMSNVLEGTFPEGWRSEINSTSVQEYPNSYGSGPRTFVGFTGTYYKGTYWRGMAYNYGKQTDHKLHLMPGNYKLTYAMAAWKGTPRYKAQILTSSGSTLKESQYYSATPNAEGNKAADLSSAVEREMTFTVTKEGDYVINFYTDGGEWGGEMLLLSCRVNKDITQTSIDSITVGGDIVPAGSEIFDENGRKLPSLQRGINIIRRNGVEVKKVFIR